jgi:hypothetical protein
MIALASDCLVFRLENGDNVPLSSGMVSVELVGESAPLFDPDLVTHAADAVFFYFKHELGRESVSVGEFTLALETALRGFKLNPETLAKAADEPGLVRSDLGTLAGGSGEDCELFFFPRLRNELRSQLRDAPRVVQFRGLKACVKRLAGAQRWSARCQNLNDSIVEFLRNCLSSEPVRGACTLMIE